MKYYIQGSRKRGTVHLEMREVKFFYALLDTAALEIKQFLQPIRNLTVSTSHGICAVSHVRESITFSVGQG